MIRQSRIGQTSPVRSAPSGRNVLLSVLVFTVFALLWLAFGAALLWSRGTLDSVWERIRDLPLVVQGAVWLLFLPLMAGLWIWQMDWSLWLRLVLVAGLACVNLFTFYPRRPHTEPTEDGV